MTLKVLVYTPTVGRGGVKTVVETLCRAFEALSETEDVSFSILGQSFDENGVQIDYPKSWKFEQIDPIQRLPPHPYQFPFLEANYKVFIDHLLRVEDNYDVIFCPSSWWVMYPDYWPITKPFVTVIPDFAFDFIDMGYLQKHFRTASTLIAKRSAAVVFPSKFHRQHALSRYGFNRHKTITIPHSMDFVVKDYYPTQTNADRVRKKYNLSKEYVLAFHCFGHKDVGTILRAQLYGRSHSPNVPPLVIAGIETERYLTNNSDQHAQEVRRIITEIKATLGQDLFILGEVPNEDVAGLFKGATIAMFASKSEGDISGGMLNAIAAMTPLVYGDLPVFRDRLGDDMEYGLTFRIEDWYHAGIRLVEACDKPEEAKARAEKLFDMMDGYTFVDVAKAYIKVLRSAQYYQKINNEKA